MYYGGPEVVCCGEDTTVLTCVKYGTDGEEFTEACSAPTCDHCKTDFNVNELLRVSYRNIVSLQLLTLSYHIVMQATKKPEPLAESTLSELNCSQLLVPMCSVWRPIPNWLFAISKLTDFPKQKISHKHS